MKGARLRQPISSEYSQALGEAIFTFSILEWSAIWICERIQPGVLTELDPKTAGAISKRLISLAESLDGSEGKTCLLGGASRFADLVVIRNKLVHGRPGTDNDDGLSKLFGAGRPWTVDMIRDAADEFSECSIVLNDCFHGFLKGLVRSEF